MRKISVVLLSIFGILPIVTSPITVAAIIPVGVKRDVYIDTVINDWGWTVAYQGDYAATGILMETVFAGVTPGDYVMYAAKHKGSDSFALLAAGLESDVRTQTAIHQTHVANGVAWYFNGWSMGFAAGNQSIHQNHQDIRDWWPGYEDPNNPDGRTRLSWSTSGGFESAPTSLEGGWRAGQFTGLSHSSEWERFVLFARPSSTVPEPASMMIWLLISLGFSGRSRKYN